MHPLKWLPAALLLAGCTAQPSACLLPSQKPMLMIDLYFGRDVPGRSPVTDAEWATFTRTQVTPRYPDGFTVIDAHGQWLNPAARAIGAEDSKMVRIAAAAGTDNAALISAIVEAYRSQFHQFAVGISSAWVCAAF